MRPLSALLLAALFVACGTASLRAEDDFSSQVFPPADCSKDEQRVIVWQDRTTTTYCKTGQEVLDMALPECKDGQQVVKDGGKFVCKDSPTVVFKTCAAVEGDGANGAACTAMCDAGYMAIGGGCSEEGTNNGRLSQGAHSGLNDDGSDHYSGRTYVTASRPNENHTGWFCRVTEEIELPSNVKTVATGYATCLKLPAPSTGTDIDLGRHPVGD